MISKKWKNLSHIAEANNCFNSSESDHQLAMAKIRLSLRMKKIQAKKARYAVSALTNQQFQEKYTIAVSKRFSVLSN